MASDSELERRPHGRLVNSPGGYRAYVRPRFRRPWREGLTVKLSYADRAIGRLAGEGRRLPNPLRRRLDGKGFV